MTNDIDKLLTPFQRFGVHLGLDRIKKLLADLGDPHLKTPMIHVTGTNGKGSVCAYLSSILTQAGYKVGRYTSPHLIDWTERISINQIPITQDNFVALIKETQEAIDPTQESPTQFEVITAAAWLYFVQQKVDIAIVEVGLGGRLDATNVCPSPLVSIITSISREHWQQLGPTLAHIATEKAGIFKSGCPGVIGILPPEAKQVVKDKLQQLNCPAIWVQPAISLSTDNQNHTLAAYKDITYTLPLLGDIQLMNSAIAISAIEILQQFGWKITTEAIQSGIAKTRWLGRLQWITKGNQLMLIDGAHNPAAAIALRQYVETLDRRITWVMGMLSTKEHKEIFQALLRPQDKLYLVPVPDHSSADPIALAKLAQEVCPKLGDCQTFSDLFLALKKTQQTPENLTVLCGSLYLVGYFLSKIDSLGG